MIRLMLLSLLALMLSSCLDEENHAVSRPEMGYGMAVADDLVANRAMAKTAAAPMAEQLMQASDMVLDRSQFEGRRIAENHQMAIETPREGFQKRYRRDMSKCIALGCEIIGSNIQSNGHGYLNARITPQNLGVYLDFLSDGPGEVKSHQVSATDKTMQYVDTESKLKNQKALRERLLRLLDSPKAKKIEEILNVERELTRVQSQIDSLTGQMQSLEKITSKATVNVSYSIPPKAVEIEYHDISNSLRYAWNGFLRSISDVIAFVLKAIPWIPIWFIGVWLLVKVFRFAFRKTGSATRKLMFWKKSKDAESKS